MNPLPIFFPFSACPLFSVSESDAVSGSPFSVLHVTMYASDLLSFFLCPMHFLFSLFLGVSCFHVCFDWLVMFGYARPVVWFYVFP